jgi:hypothetical protein
VDQEESRLVPLGGNVVVCIGVPVTGGEALVEVVVHGLLIDGCKLDGRGLTFEGKSPVHIPISTPDNLLSSQAMKGQCHLSFTFWYPMSDRTPPKRRRETPNSSDRHSQRA